MKRLVRTFWSLVVLSLFLGALAATSWSESAPPVVATDIVKSAIDYWRGQSSSAQCRMTIHRPSWQRDLAFEAWTKGSDLSLVRFTAPPKDAGSASLTSAHDMWSFTPKVNRTIRIPASMRAQTWMGSDFSYQDLAKADDLLKHYDHHLLSSEERDGLKVYVIESIPHDDAPVVWGKETLRIRADYIVLEHSFYDQEMRLVKQLSTGAIEKIGGKLYPRTMRMTKTEQPDEWTEVTTTEAQFDSVIPDNFFSLSNLRNPRPIP
jgi:hypothetical protein